MIIIGHKAIEFNDFKKIESIDNIQDTSANEIIWFKTDNKDSYDIAKHCKQNDIKYAVFVSSIKEVIIFANLNAKFIIIKEQQLVITAQKIANEYFFDSKILYIINDEKNIEDIAMLGIDGIIFNDILK